VTPDQEAGEHESETVGDDASFETQGDTQSEAFFKYFYPADGGAGEE